MSGKPRTLILTRHYAPEPTGSAPPMQQLAEWLAADGRASEVVTARPSYPEPNVVAGYAKGERDDVVEAGVKVRRLPTTVARGSSLLARAVPEAQYMLQLLAMRATGKLAPSTQLISLCPSILTVAAATRFRARGGRHVVIVHDIQSGLGAALGSRSVRLVMGLLRGIECWALNQADHLIVLSQAMADAILELGVQTPLTILPPQIDCAVIRPLPRPPGPPTLMYSGNLGRKQGLEQLLDLAVVLARSAPDVRIVLRGEGAAKADLLARIARDRLSNVALLPLVAREDLARSLAEADLHLVPQIADGGDFAVPSKAFAIMAAGRTFVTTASAQSSIARMAEESHAFSITPPNDAEAFARIVLVLLADEGRRRTMAEAGRAFAERTADTPVVMRRIVELIEASATR